MPVILRRGTIVDHFAYNRQINCLSIRETLEDIWRSGSFIVWQIYSLLTFFIWTFQWILTMRPAIVVSRKCLDYTPRTPPRTTTFTMELFCASDSIELTFSYLLSNCMRMCSNFPSDKAWLDSARIVILYRKELNGVEYIDSTAHRQMFVGHFTWINDIVVNGDDVDDIDE